MLSHYMTVDIPGTFFATLALLLAARALHAPKTSGAVGFIVAVGFAAGLAAGTKYNLVTVVLAASFLLLVPAKRTYVRYVAPLIPPLAILAARAADEGMGSGASGDERAEPARARRRLWGLGAGIAAAAALASTVAHLGVIS